MFSQQEIQAALDRCFGFMTDPDKLYVIMSNSIGDMVVVGGFVHALLPKFGKKSADMIIRDRIGDCGVTFDGVDKFHYLTISEMAAVNFFLTMTKRFIGPNYIHANPHQFIKPPVGDRVSTMLDHYTTNVLDLPIDTPSHPPIVKDVPEEIKRQLDQKYVLDKDHTIILAPHANSKKSPGIDFWQRLIAGLQSKGFVVYTNVGKNLLGNLEPPLPGTIPMYVSLNEMFYVADNVKRIIGLRSGLFDLLSFSKGNLLVMNPTNGDYSGIFNLMFKSMTARCRSLCMEYSFYEKVNELMEHSLITSAEFKILKHKCVPPQDIMLNEEMLLTTILQDVFNT